MFLLSDQETAIIGSNLWLGCVPRSPYSLPYLGEISTFSTENIKLNQVNSEFSNQSTIMGRIESIGSVKTWETRKRDNPAYQRKMMQMWINSKQYF